MSVLPTSGTTLTVDPTSGVPADKVTPLVGTKGYESGVRSEPLPGWRTTLSLWSLGIDSEWLFVGDAGVTGFSRSIRRYGVEWNNLYAVNSRPAIDADIAWSHARFRGDEPTGNTIPGAGTTNPHPAEPRVLRLSLRIASNGTAYPGVKA
ncbi:MAG: hypothetical protein HY777_12680 [Betaproteobacteria bacterium]|nr:hypothetical protein [Betaproteobacteria bacterium]